MQVVSDEYKRAITGSPRKILPLAVMDLIDPDITYKGVHSNGEMSHSDPLQIYDKKLEAEGPLYATLEKNRFLLDGSFTPFADDPAGLQGEHGYLINCVAGQDGAFRGEPPFVELSMENLGILQAASVHFTGLECDGQGVDFLFEIFSGDEVVYSKEVKGNTEPAVYFEGFTVHDVTALRATFRRWSHPLRYARICELLPGIYEQWDGGELCSIDVLHETSLDNMATPYGTCTLKVWNKNRRFNPFSKSSLFQSIEARQGIPVSFGVEVSDGSMEYVPLGVYYQQNGGWETDAYGMTISFKLSDIVGMIANRDYVLPNPIPATLGAWIESITAHLGENFKDRFQVDASIAGRELTATEEALKGMKCGQILRFACMAAGAFFRADAASGKLKVKPLPEGQGITMDAENMSGYPQNQAGDSIAQITFRLADDAKTEHVIEGTLKASDKSLSISNPFIHTAAEAEASAAHIKQFYETTKFTVKGRGDMRSELGDTDEFETGFGTTAVGRRYKQQFKLDNGVMKNVPSYLIAAGKIVDEE